MVVMTQTILAADVAPAGAGTEEIRSVEKANTPEVAKTQVRDVGDGPSQDQCVNEAAPPGGIAKEQEGANLAEAPLTGLEKPDKVGNNSVDITRVTIVKPSFKAVVANQNIIWRIEQQLLRSEHSIEIEDEDGMVIVNGIVGLPKRVAEDVWEEFSVQYPRFIPHNRELIPHPVTYTNAVEEDTLDLTNAREYMRGPNLSIKAVADALRANDFTSREVSEMIAPSFNRSLRRNDMSAIWFVGTLVEMQLSDLEGMIIAPVFGPRIPNSVQYVQIDPIPVNAGQSAALINNAIASGRIVLDYHALTREDMLVLFLLSIGTNGITTRAGEMNHILTYVHTPGFQFTLYGHGAAPVWPVPVLLSASQVRNTMHRLAAMMGCEAHLVQGFVRASMLINGYVTEEINDIGIEFYRLVPASFELGSQGLPRPIAHNFMWRLLGLDIARPHTAAFANEYSRLSNMASTRRNRITAGIASAFSLCISIVFHRLNLTGRELNSWGLEGPLDPRRAYSLVDALFQTEPHQRQAPLIYCLAHTIMPQLSEAVIRIECFRGQQFSANGANLDNFTAGRLWQGVWGTHIPYMLQPPVMAWFFVTWAAEWGLSGPAAGLDLNGDVVLSGGPDYVGLVMRKGDIHYDKMALGKTPYSYVPYGAFVLNALTQQLRIAEQPDIWFTPITSGGDGTVNIFPHQHRQAWQPNQLPHIFTMVVGTLTTYDWVENLVIAPVWRAADMDNAIWNNLHSQRQVATPFSGIVTNQDRQPHYEVHSGIEALEEMFGGASLAIDENAGTSATAAKEAEN